MLTAAKIMAIALAKYPNLQDLLLQTKDASIPDAETFSDGVAWRGRWRGCTLEEMAFMQVGVAAETRTWELVEDGQAELPRPGCRIVEADGTFWSVRVAMPTALQVVYSCLTVREYSA